MQPPPPEARPRPRSTRKDRCRGSKGFGIVCSRKEAALHLMGWAIGRFGTGFVSQPEKAYRGGSGPSTWTSFDGSTDQSTQARKSALRLLNPSSQTSHTLDTLRLLEMVRSPKPLLPDAIAVRFARAPARSRPLEGSSV